MSADRQVPDAPLTHPLTDPVTTLAPVDDRRNVGHVESLGEATIWRHPQMSTRPSDRREGVWHENHTRWSR